MFIYSLTSVESKKMKCEWWRRNGRKVGGNIICGDRYIDIEIYKGEEK